MFILTSAVKYLGECYINKLVTALHLLTLISDWSAADRVELQWLLKDYSPPEQPAGVVIM